MRVDSNPDPLWPSDHIAAASRVLAHARGDFRRPLTPIGEGDFCLAFRHGREVIRDFVHIYEDVGAGMLAAVLRHYARESPSSLAPRIRMWCVLEALMWTAARDAEQEVAQVEQGLAEIVAELDALEI